MYLSGKEWLICLEMESTAWNQGVLQVLSSWWELKEGQDGQDSAQGCIRAYRYRGANVKGSTWAGCLQYVGTGLCPPGGFAIHGDRAMPTQGWDRAMPTQGLCNTWAGCWDGAVLTQGWDRAVPTSLCSTT